MGGRRNHDGLDWAVSFGTIPILVMFADAIGRTPVKTLAKRAVTGGYGRLETPQRYEPSVTLIVKV